VVFGIIVLGDAHSGIFASPVRKLKHALHFALSGEWGSNWCNFEPHLFSN
jgi:hypothetical protein